MPYPAGEIPMNAVGSGGWNMPKRKVGDYQELFFGFSDQRSSGGGLLFGPGRMCAASAAATDAAAPRVLRAWNWSGRLCAGGRCRFSGVRSNFAAGFGGQKR